MASNHEFSVGGQLYAPSRIVEDGANVQPYPFPELVRNQKEANEATIARLVEKCNAQAAETKEANERAHGWRSAFETLKGEGCEDWSALLEENEILNRKLGDAEALTECLKRDLRKSNEMTLRWRSRFETEQEVWVRQRDARIEAEETAKNLEKQLEMLVLRREKIQAGDKVWDRLTGKGPWIVERVHDSLTSCSAYLGTSLEGKRRTVDAGLSTLTKDPQPSWWERNRTKVLVLTALANGIGASLVGAVLLARVL